MHALKLFPTAFFVAFLVIPCHLHAAADGCQDGFQIEKLLAQLPQAKRRILEDTLRRTDRQNRKLREKEIHLEAELEDLMKAPGFDERTYLDKSAKLGTLRAKMHANLEDAIAAVAAQFTPEERRILLKVDKLWRVHGNHDARSGDDREDSHQPSAE